MSGTEIDAMQALRTGRPLLDVRSPGEFAQGNFPQATNLPLLNDEERHQVGLAYKKLGREPAIALGHELVSGVVKKERIDGWARFIAANPESLVCCWRGGMRSGIAVDWLATANHQVARVEGGFKALRNQALVVLGEFADRQSWIVLGGRTGVGKTLLLPAIEAAIDLEGHAEHRGSAFGGFGRPQPSPVTFDNRLAMAAIAHKGRHVVVEDEAMMIGSVPLPKSWFAKMNMAPVVVLRLPMAERVANIADEYVAKPLASGVALEDLAQRYTASLLRIRRRLGDERWRTISEALCQSFVSGDHDAWIRPLLADYYDRMYDYQLDKKKGRIVFEGNTDEVREYLQQASKGAVD